MQDNIMKLVRQIYFKTIVYDTRSLLRNVKGQNAKDQSDCDIVHLMYAYPRIIWWHAYYIYFQASSRGRVAYGRMWIARNRPDPFVHPHGLINVFAVLFLNRKKHIFIAQLRSN